MAGLWYFRRLRNRSNANGRNHLGNNNRRLVGITQIIAKTPFIMKTHKKLWNNLTSYKNLEIAYRKARKHKTTKDYVIEFEKYLKNNLLLLQSELLLHSYRPKPLVNFIIRDPKSRNTRKSKIFCVPEIFDFCGPKNPLLVDFYDLTYAPKPSGKAAIQPLLPL